MGTKEKIFSCALALFSEKGFEGVSIRDIAKAVGINESSIYNHYAGKRAIIDDVCNRFADTLTISCPPLSEVEKLLDNMSPSEVFKTFINSYGRQINPQIAQMAKTVLSEQYHDETVKQIFLDVFIQKSSRYYAEVLDLFEHRKLIKPCDKSIVANVFNNSQVALSIQFAHCRTNEEFASVVKMMQDSVDLLIGSLETEG